MEAEEIFTVSSINRKHHSIMYKLKDYNNEIIGGSFCRHVIERVIHKDDVYLLEKIIRTERQGHNSWCLVKS